MLGFAICDREQTSQTLNKPREAQNPKERFTIAVGKPRWDVKVVHVVWFVFVIYIYIMLEDLSC